MSQVDNDPPSLEAPQETGASFPVIGEVIQEHNGDLTPSNIAELYDFYHSFVKRLYSVVQAENTLPAEVLYEIHAAFDHVTRIETFNEQEDQAVRKAYSHFKRACLDVYKIYFRDSLEMFEELKKIDTSAIDNGDFDFKLRHLIDKIRKNATEARRLEGDKSQDTVEKVLAFDRWQLVARDCQIFRNEFYLHKSISWAKKRNWRKGIAIFVYGAISGIVFSVVGNWIWSIITEAFKSAK